jgi:hypothetical protein
LQQKHFLQGEPVSESNKIEPPTQVGQAQHKRPLQPLTQELHRAPAKPERPLARPSMSSERAEILHRVASFKAHQVKLGQDREKYYERVQEKIRTSLADPFKSKPM